MLQSKLWVSVLTRTFLSAKIVSGRVYSWGRKDWGRLQEEWLMRPSSSLYSKNGHKCRSILFTFVGQ